MSLISQLPQIMVYLTEVCDENEGILINDGAVADVNCCCKHEFLCKWNC